MSDDPKMDSGKIVRFCLVALPVGIILLGVGSLAYTQLTGGPSTDDVEAAEKQAKAAGIMRREIDRVALEKYVEIIAGDIGERNVGAYENLKTAAYWIESTLGPNNMGFRVRKQRFEAAGKEVWNVIAELPGTSRRDEVVVIGAHYDTVADCPGANDNGTGVAALLSLANTFSGTENARTLRFVAFVNEEPPFFQTEQMGSLVYARYLNEEEGADVVAMLALETIGHFDDSPGSQKVPEGLTNEFPDVADFIAIVGNASSKGILESARSAYEQSGSAAKVPMEGGIFPVEVAGVGWSDHWSFWQVGYPAVMLTDTAPYRYPHYHKPTDRPNQIDFARFTEVVKGMRAVIDTWANP